VSREQSSEQRGRPLLIVLSTSPQLPAEVRSRTRDVRVWADSGQDQAEQGQGVFTGDPTEPATFEWARDAHGVTAVIDMSPSGLARGALRALRAVRPDAAVLLLSDEVADLDGLSDGTLARSGKLRDVLRLDLDEELLRLEAERRLHCLRQFAAGADIVPILIHDDPDPDAVSSALAVATLLGSRPDRTPIVTMDPMTRPENQRMAELLRIRITRVTRDELRRFARIITVDTQPRDLQVAGQPRLAVIDHHPIEHSYDADFLDVRSEYGATATMMTEYLRAVGEERISASLATALLFGIKTDTDSLMRGVTPADVAAYAFLQERADVDLVRRFERPSYPPETARAFGRALETATFDDGICVAFAGQLEHDQAHVLADLADFCLAVEHVTWVVVASLLDDELVLTLRYSGRGAGAGTAARAIARRGGSGGGHETMARVAIPRDRAAELLGEGIGAGVDEDAVTRIRALLDDVLQEVTGEEPDNEESSDRETAAPVNRPA
jgi:nanoRNase/pAp phosphatase (c-di-AMP/oligoRNAs hydrolase)